MKYLLTLSLILFNSCASVNQMANQTSPLMNGQTPELRTEVTNIKNEKIKLKTIIKRRPTVLVFYRGGWCPYCNKQLARLRKITKDINKLGYQLIAVSPDHVSKFKESISKHKLDYEVISDSKLNLAKAFGLSFKVDNKTLFFYKSVGIDLEKASGETHHSLPIPAVYVLDTNGLIHFNYLNPNYKVRLNEKILLNALKELNLGK